MMTKSSLLYSPQVLVVENDENDAVILSRVLLRVGVDMKSDWVCDLNGCIDFLHTQRVDLIISDYNLLTGTALDVLLKIQELHLSIPVIVVSHQIGEKAAVEVMKAGAKDVVNKADFNHLVATVSKELIALESVREREHLTNRLYDIDKEKRELQDALLRVREAEAQTSALLAQLNKVFESSPDGIRVIDRDCNVLRVNANYLKFIDGAVDNADAGKCFASTPRSWCHTSQCPLKRALAGEYNIEEHLTIKRSNGEERNYVLSVSALVGSDGEVDGIVENMKDVTDWQRMQRQMMHAQKMESIGQLAAGIAHEINTPTQFVGDNISFLKDSFADLLGLVAIYDEVTKLIAGEGFAPALIEKIEDAKVRFDVEYLAEEIPKAIEQSGEGIVRISSIVKAMKEFSHPGSEEAELYNINQNIQNTVTVARNEWKYVSRVELDLGSKLPLVRGYPGEFNQTVLNIIVNAAHAIEAKSATMENWKGTIGVKTFQQNGYVVIQIKDNGIGIPAEIQNRIFDPFFTTKGVGKGTGQGLAIAHSSIVDKHHGTIAVASVVGEGTTFTITLPTVELEQSKEP